MSKKFTVIIDKLLTSTSEMNSECFGWYIKLLLHQVDKDGIPDDSKILAGMCNVQPDEYDRFKKAYNQHIRNKFSIVNTNGRLENPVAKKSIKLSSSDKEVKVRAGKISAVVRLAKSTYPKIFNTNNNIKKLKEHLPENIETVNVGLIENIMVIMNHKTSNKSTKKKDNTKYSLKTVLIEDHGVSTERAIRWVDKIRKGKNESEDTYNRLVTEAKKANISVKEAVIYCCSMSWIGFNSNYYFKNEGKKDADDKTKNDGDKIKIFAD